MSRPYTDDPYSVLGLCCRTTDSAHRLDDFLAGGTQGEHASHQKIEGGGTLGLFHLGHTGLSRTDPTRDLGLRQVELVAAFRDGLRERKVQFDVHRFLGRKSEE